MSINPTLDEWVRPVQRIHAKEWGPIRPPLTVAIGRKVGEEGLELAMELGRGELAERQLVEHEIGDVLFVVLAACRVFDTDPAAALAAAAERNRERWRVD